MEDFVADLKSSSLLARPAFYPGDLEATLTSQIGQYEKLRAILDRHAPLQHKKAPTRPPSPWINDKILSARRALRKAERIWRRSGYQREHFLRYRALVSGYASLLRSTKSDHYRSEVTECRGNQRRLFTLVDDWLGKPKTTLLPTSSSNLDLANKFSSFFSDKVERIKADLDSTRASIDPALVVEAPAFQLIS